jgi:predicted amidophosphoribosyltransferase
MPHREEVTAMAICPACQQQNSDTAVFCSSCGQRLLVAAPPAQAVAVEVKGEARHNPKATAGLVLGIISLVA